jgi:AraC-like DNA-binding protein
MVKMGQAPSGIADIPFARGRPLQMEALTLQWLLRHERNHDLSRPQRPAFHHFFLVTGGEGSHSVDFTRHRLRPGAVLHVAPGQVQQFGCEAALEAALVIFEPDFVRQVPATTGLPTRPSPSRLATITALFEAAAREFAAFDGSERARRLLRGLVEAIGQALDVGPELPPDAELVHAFRAALERSFPRAHEVAAYAAILRCSTRTLTRHCERWVGKPAKRLIDERVALEAKRLLAHGGAPVADVARGLGFADATQFGKFFRRLTDDTPARFRARYREPLSRTPPRDAAHSSPRARAPRRS